MASPEAEIQKSICDYLTRRKHFFWRNNTGAVKTAHGSFMRFGTPGSPDIILIKDGYFIGLEVKAKGKQSAYQKEFERGVKAAGGEYYVVRSIDDVREVGL